jgi:SAM-dependent methyltransferase
MTFLDRIHPERGVAGFTKSDGTVLFYNFVKAAICRVDARRVLDFGAGRGGPFHTPIRWRRELRDLRQFGAEVWAADVDPVVATHPASHHQVVLEIGKPLPFDDEFFDVIVSDFTFEHIDDPDQVAPELLRVLKPGGFICARTANRHGYIKLAASLVPNRLHVKALGRIQPHRDEKDVFPTVYKMNTVSQIRTLFPGCELHWYRDSADPAYFFNSGLLYRLFRFVHWVLPERFATIICFFIRKPPAR